MMRNLRLGIVSQYFWPESFVINDIAASFSERGVAVSVLTGKPNYPDGVVQKGYRAGGIMSDRVGSVDVLRLPIWPRGKNIFSLCLNYLSFICSATFWGPRWGKRNGFDVILVYGVSPLLQAIPAAWIARRCGVPLALWVQDLWPESLSATGFAKNRVLLWLLKRVVSWIYCRSDLILAQSEAFIPAIAKRAPEEKTIVYLPNPYPEALTTPSLVDLPAHIHLKNFVVMFAGNLGAAQSLETLIEAAIVLDRCDDCKIVIVGSGRRADWMQAQIAHHKLNNIIMIGRQPFSIMPALFAQAQALIVTLGNDAALNLTLPSKVQAYLAAGRPIIGALNGEAARIIDQSGAGISVAAEDGSALAQAILALKELPEEQRDQMGKAGRQYFEAHFSLDHVVGELMRQLQGAVQQSKERK